MLSPEVPRAPSRQARPIVRPAQTLRTIAIQPAVSQAEGDSPFRRMAFYAALVMIFVRFGIIPELLVAATGVNTYILYIVGPPAIIGCLITGGFGRAFQSKPVLYWTGFFVCMLLATPFSSWAGASAIKDFDYARTDLVCLYIIAGLVVTWEEVVKTVKVIGYAGFVTLLAARVYAKPDTNGRLSLDMGFDGVITNANDLAAHLLLLLPFIIYLICRPGRNNVVRVMMSVCVFYGIWVILGTSSRGAMVGLLAIAAFLFFRASGAQRFAVLLAVPVLAAFLLVALPRANVARLATLFGGAPVMVGEDDEAGESMESRRYLFEQSIKYTFEHPLFGVGPSQFANFEGLTSRAAGEHGNWHETHNTYTQISSECGIPAFLLAMASLVGVFRLVSKTYKAAAQRRDKEVVQVCLWYLTSLAGYMVTIAFLACAYRFTLPAMVGLGAAIHVAAQRRLAAADTVPCLMPLNQVRKPFHGVTS